MAIGRYTFVSKVPGKRALATSANQTRIYNAVVNGMIAFTPKVIQGNQRLDQIAAAAYGSSSYWWIIAAASGIGWGLQVPPGTIVRVPKNLSDILAIIR
jgi:hypothetical protein